MNSVENPKSRPKRRKRWIASVAVLVMGLSVFGYIGYNEWIKYKTREADFAAKKSNHEAYLACKQFWADNGSDLSCSVKDVSVPKYGFKAQEGVSIECSGDEMNFDCTSKHEKWGTREYTMGRLCCDLGVPHDR
jgi:hypothetical protein